MFAAMFAVPCPPMGSYAVTACRCRSTKQGSRMGSPVFSVRRRRVPATDVLAACSCRLRSQGKPVESGAVPHDRAILLGGVPGLRT